MISFVLLALVVVQGTLGSYVPRELPSQSVANVDELTRDVRQMNGALMGMAEFVIEINQNVKALQRTFAVSPPRFYRKSDDEVHQSREQIARRIEKLYARNDPVVDKMKLEMEKRIQFNFIKMLSAILVTGPVHVQERSQDILKLMKSVLNGELDFKPVVNKLPFLIRDTETNQFVLLLKTMRDSELSNVHARQFGGLQNINKVVDILGTVDLKEVSGFLKEIPELFEAVETIVEGTEEYFA